MRAVHRLAQCVLLVALWAGQAAAGEAPRVVSINACTDQLVLKLADPGQIASVSEYAASPSFSYMAEAAKDFPANQGHAEEVLAHDPDLVISGPYTNRATSNRLEALGYRVETLDSPDTFPGIRDNLRRMGELLGHPGRAERLIERMDRTLAAVAEDLPPENRRLRALALRPNGVTVGKGSLLDTVMQAAGLRNVGRELGAGSYRELPLEHLVRTQPDLLVLASSAEAQPSLAQGVMHHPVFDALKSQREPLWLPGRLWTCGGWFNAEAVARLAEHAYGVRVPETDTQGETAVGH